MTKERKQRLVDFCKRTDIKFHNLELLDQAFHHRSLTNEKKGVKNNERLEFLGDSVLGMVTAAYLYENSDRAEGELSKIKSTVVSEKSLAPIALCLKIDTLLELGHGEEVSGGRKKPAILADCMEAVIGAYYLDSGFKAAKDYVLSFIEPAVKELFAEGFKDYKTQLQERFQKTTKQCPRYELVSKTGPDHDQTFEVVVHLGNKTFGPCKAKTKKDAEQEAAKIALTQIADK